MNLLLPSSGYEFQTTWHHPPQLYLEDEAAAYSKMLVYVHNTTLYQIPARLVLKHSKYTLGPVCSSSSAYFISERNYFIMC
jgi:hypothetical protein